MPEIKKVYSQSMPAVKFVGKCYRETEKVNGTFGCKWDEWFKNDLFSPLKIDLSDDEPFEDCNAYIGLCRVKDGEPFEYMIGVFLPPDFKVPEGYDSLSFDAGKIGVAWIYGKEPDIYTYCCLSELEKAGLIWKKDKNGVKWCFERYVNPRFTTPDDKGNVILDMCFYV